MIIERVTLRNFGLYKDENSLVFTPSGNKTVVLISGKNGVGKSTLQEAIQLCLFGVLSLEGRTTEAQYLRHLQSRSHQDAENGDTTSIEVALRIVREGRESEYRIIRRWPKTLGNFSEDIEIWQNHQLLPDLTLKEKNAFIRELVNPGLIKVMFFDGEKLSSLYEADKLRQFIRESCWSLFGLEYVELLKKDVSLFQERLLNKPETKKHTTELQEVQRTLLEIDSERQCIIEDRMQIQEDIEILRELILKKEKEVASQGRWATKRLDKLKADKQKNEERLRIVKKELTEIYSHLGPFVFAGSLLGALKQRLLNEREVEKWQHAQELLLRKADELVRFLRNELQQDDSHQLFSGVREVLLSKPSAFPESDVIHHPVTDTDRTKLLAWIDLINGEVKTLLKKHILEVSQIEEELKGINKELVSFSGDDIIKPLLQNLQELNKSLGGSEQSLESLNRKFEEAGNRKKFYESRKESLEAKLARDDSFDKKFSLSSSTLKALEEYEKRLLVRKLSKLQELVVARFNALCRKKSYVDSISIEPDSFEIALQKKGNETNHQHLSAGEKQVLVLAFLWGLRDMTNISIPLIIDTPLARLDSEHRDSFISLFLPSVGSQTICIGTDMEINNDMITSILPYTAWHYQLQYDESRHATAFKVVADLEPLSAS